MISGKSIILDILAFTIALPMVFGRSCPHGVEPVIFMKFYPSAVTTVGSNVQLYCNASVIGLNNMRTHDSLWLSIFTNDTFKELNVSRTTEKTVECTFDIMNVTHSDSKAYRCVARLSAGSQGCSQKNAALIVKDCTDNKDESFHVNAVLTERKTIRYKWKYMVQSCDQAYRVFWSSDGPVDLKSSSKILPLNITTYEIKKIELNSRRKYWVGMAVQTSKGLSRIYRVKTSFGPVCTSNKNGRFTMNGSITENNTISFIWNYEAESCDESFAIYWSKEGPISNLSQPQLFIKNTNVTSFETKELESNTQYWIGMAVVTTRGSSKIFVHNSTLKTGAIHDDGDSDKHKPKETDVTTPVLIFIFLIICLVGIFSTVFLVVRKRRQKSHDSIPVVQVTNGAAQNLDILYPETEGPVVNIPPLSPKIFLDDVFEESEEIIETERTDAGSDYLTVLDEWEISRDQLSVTSMSLGSGQFGVVMKGTFRTHDENGGDFDLPVAVKTLRDKATEIDRSDIVTELRILKFVNTLPHPNILKLIGACTSEEPILVVTEYCARGNLKHVLKKYREILNGTIPAKSEPELTNDQLLSMAVDVACAMKHLVAMKFVHRDLAARNILVTESWVAKISDFGLARETSINGEYVKNRRNLLPVKWTAIEALVEGKFTSASDVWSFGVLLWEIANIGGTPYKEISPHDIMSHVGSGGRLAKPDRCSLYLFSIMSECWKTEPQKRPTFATLHQKLSAMLEEETTYINVGFLSDGGKDNNGYYELERYTTA